MVSIPVFFSVLSIAVFAIVLFVSIFGPLRNDASEMWLTVVYPSRSPRPNTFLSLGKASTVRLDCEDERTDTIFLIFSKAAAWKSRANLRDTLLSPRSKSFFRWTGVFFVQETASHHNNSVADKEDKAAYLASEWLAVESDVMEDLVSLKPIPRQGVIPVASAAESFLSALEWADDHCHRARHFIKMADNVVVEPTTLRRYLKWSVDYKANGLHCRLASTRRTAAAETHCREDGAVIMTKNAIRSLLTEHSMGPPNATKDIQQSGEAYVTGDLALASNVARRDFASVDEGWDADEWAPKSDSHPLWPRGDDSSGSNMLATLGGKQQVAGIERRALWYLSVWEATLVKPAFAKALPIGEVLRSEPSGVTPADEPTW